MAQPGSDAQELVCRGLLTPLWREWEAVIAGRQPQRAAAPGRPGPSRLCQDPLGAGFGRGPRARLVLGQSLVLHTSHVKVSRVPGSHPSPVVVVLKASQDFTIAGIKFMNFPSCQISAYAVASARADVTLPTGQEGTIPLKALHVEERLALVKVVTNSHCFQWD